MVKRMAGAEKERSATMRVRRVDRGDREDVGDMQRRNGRANR